MIVDKERLTFFKELYKGAVSSDDFSSDMKKWYSQYRGDFSVEGARDALVIRNITYELIESQVSSEIPVPVVSAELWSEENERNARKCELALMSMRNALPFERLNDMDERYTYIFGGSVWLVEWEENKRGSGKGGIKVTGLDPTALVGQPGVYDVDEMEYLFIRYKTVKDELIGRWGLSHEDAELLTEEGENHTVQVVICFYRNEKGYVSLYAFTGDTELAYFDDYYARKKETCALCGLERALCRCEKGEYTFVSAEYEVLDKDIRRNGKLPIAAGTKIPWYRPMHFPIVVRKNTSKRESVFGQSDCEFIRPQQLEINKILSRVHEKLVMSGVYPYKPDDCRFQFDNTVGGKVLNLAPGDSPHSFGVIDTTPDISKDLEYVKENYESAKRILGISDTYQGINDDTAISGRAKEIQVNQAAGRLRSKRAMKNYAYAEIYRRAFELMLAFDDEERPLAIKDALGRIEEDSFSRYDFIRRNSSDTGYYYDDAYLFSSASDEREEDRRMAWERNLENYKAGVFGAVNENITLLRYWQAQERAHYPGARENAEYFKNEISKNDGKASDDPPVAVKGKENAI